MPHCCPLLATEGNYLRGRNGKKHLMVKEGCLVELSGIRYLFLFLNRVYRL